MTLVLEAVRRTRFSIRRGSSAGVALFLAAVSGALWFPEPLAAAARPTMVVRQENDVIGSKVKLGDIALFQSQTEEEEQLVKQLREAVVGQVATLREPVVISAEQILNTISQTGVRPDSIGFRIPSVVTVRRKTRTLGSDELRAIIAPAVTEQLAGGVVREVIPDMPVMVPEEGFTTKIEEVKLTEIPARAVLSVSDREETEVARYPLRVNLLFRRILPVMRRAVDRGEVIQPSDVEVRSFESQRDSGEWVESTADLIGRVALVRLPADSPVKRQSAEIPATVTKGGKLVVAVESGFLKVTVLGTALQDGHTGEVIAVRNDRSKKVIQARIRSGQEAELVEQ